MKQWLSQQGAVFYMMMAIVLVGLIMTAVANRVYKGLIKDSDDVENSANRLVKYIKLKYTSYYKLGLMANDEKALVRSYLSKYKVGPIALDTLCKIGIAARYAVGSLAIGYLLFSLTRGKSVADMYAFIGVAIISLLFMTLQYKLCEFNEKREVFCWNMYDYLSNFLKNKIDKGNNDMSMPEKAAEENFSLDYQDKQRKKAVSQAAAAQVPKSRKTQDFSDTLGHGRLSLDDDIDAKIVEDILKEFLV